MPLALSFPADRTAPPKDLEIRPKQVKAWLDSLPLQQCMDASRKLLEHVRAMNGSRFDVDARLQVLEVYRPIAAVLLEELDALYGRSTAPLGGKAREALVVARDLAAEMAVGYKIAIAE